jgi:hypothetical protein
MNVRQLLGKMALAAVALAVTASVASAQATVQNGTIAIGVNADGSLNTAVGSVAVNSSRTGVAYKFPDGAYRDATSPGCFCEGWGVTVTTAGLVDHSGYANVSSDGGPVNLTIGAFVSDADSATTSTSVTSLPGLTVTHDYQPSVSANLYEVTVTITNGTGGALSDVMYRRVMDWDVPLTEFAEFVTIQGALLGDLVFSGDNGFCSARAGSACAAILPGTTNTNFVDSGPADHGAVFDFNFGTLAAGESKTFKIFYGAAGTEAAALAALALVGAEGIYSLGQSSPPSGSPTAGTPATFIFGFGGVGAPPIPEPASLLLLGGGFAAVLARRYRRK